MADKIEKKKRIAVKKLGREDLQLVTGGATYECPRDCNKLVVIFGNKADRFTVEL
ncbi:MAG: hypothetical protein HY698_04750 [Deltaproteobacteria bacterium]|nr:hypothetical protein [Deltaproteobacteria bacterium]